MLGMHPAVTKTEQIHPQNIPCRTVQGCRPAGMFGQVCMLAMNLGAKYLCRKRYCTLMNVQPVIKRGLMASGFHCCIHKQ